VEVCIVGFFDLLRDGFAEPGTTALSLRCRAFDLTSNELNSSLIEGRFQL